MKSETTPLHVSKNFGILPSFSVEAEREVEHPNREPQNNLAPCAIGLPFAGMFDPITQGAFLNMRSNT